jgi:hypothetical protein
MLQNNNEVITESNIFTCDRCGCSLSEVDDEMEWQERFIISFRAGYGSVFGDGNYIEGGFCQKCIQEVLGEWLRVTSDDPFDSSHKPGLDVEKILQAYQLKKLLAGRIKEE